MVGAPKNDLYCQLWVKGEQEPVLSKVRLILYEADLSQQLPQIKHHQTYTKGKLRPTSDHLFQVLYIDWAWQNSWGWSQVGNCLAKTMQNRFGKKCGKYKYVFLCLRWVGSSLISSAAPSLTMRSWTELIISQPQSALLR